MKTLIMILTLFLGSIIVYAGDLEQRAEVYARFTGMTYDTCLYFLQLGTWCKEHPQGGTYGRTVYDAKQSAVTLARITAALTTPATPEDIQRAELSRQISANKTKEKSSEDKNADSRKLLVSQYAKATGRAPAECLQAVNIIEWCAANANGGIIHGKRFEAGEVTEILKQAQALLTTPAKPLPQTPPNYAAIATYVQPAAPVYGVTPGAMYNAYRVGNISMTYGSDGTSYNTYRFGNNSMTYGSDGTSYNTYRFGNNSMTYGSDGTSYNTYRFGNNSMTYGSDGTSYNTYRFGNSSMTYGSDGTSYNTYRFGNNSITYGSDGTMFNTFDIGGGSMTFGY